MPPKLLLLDNSDSPPAFPVAQTVIALGEACQTLSDIAAKLASVVNSFTGDGSSVPAIVRNPPLAILPTLSPAPPAGLGLTVAEAVNDFLVAKARSGRSDRYLRALRVSLCSFAQGRQRRPLETLTVEEVESWFDRPEWQARTQRGYLADVRTWLAWCVRRGYLDKNPAAAAEIPCLPPCAPLVIHTPSEVRQTLNLARKLDPHVMRALAVRYFAGLRSSEAASLSEAEIRGGFIEVVAAKAKTRRRRLIPIRPNLAAWLNLPGELPLTCVSNRMRGFTDALRREGVAWPHNVTRHSFCSYHLAEFGNAGKTALEAGHSEAMLFAHYREIVTPTAAAEFWSIRPE